MKIGLKFRLIILFGTVYAQGVWHFNANHVRTDYVGNQTFYNILLTEQNPFGYLKSPGFPYEYYPPNTEIRYTIEMDLRDEVIRMSSRIMLTFEVFIVQPSLACDKDGLEIIGSNNQDNVFCGSQTGKNVLSEGRKMTVRFFTDGSTQTRGYKIRVQLVNSGCSRHIYGYKSGFLTSPKHPQKYFSNDICVWKVEGYLGQRVLLRFNKAIDIPTDNVFCTQDYLAVSLTGNFKTDIKRFCHSNWTPEPMVSIGPKMLLMFRTDCCDEGAGFSVEFVLINAGFLPVQAPNIPQENNECSCGIENVGESERIVGGEMVTVPHKYPWLVGLTIKFEGKDFFFCGAAIISRMYILTAAHCVANKRESQIRVSLGAHKTEQAPKPVPIERIFMHPHFDSDAFINDIAVLKLVFPINPDWSVNLVCMPHNFMYVMPGEEAIVAGWGETKPPEQARMEEEEERSADPTAFKLKQLKVPLVSNAGCQTVYGAVILDTILCAGGVKGHDSCAGDSGGPLVYKFNGRFFIVGVVSWGINCAAGGYPGVYTRVSKFRDWVYNVTRDSQPC